MARQFATNRYKKGRELELQLQSFTDFDHPGTTFHAAVSLPTIDSPTLRPLHCFPLTLRHSYGRTVTLTLVHSGLLFHLSFLFLTARLSAYAKGCCQATSWR